MITKSTGTICGNVPCNPTLLSVGDPGTFSALAAGDKHSLALKDRVVWAWGDNTVGHLGAPAADSCNGSPCSRTALMVQGLEEVITIAAGENHNLALQSDGTVWAWVSTTVASSATAQPRRARPRKKSSG